MPGTKKPAKKEKADKPIAPKKSEGQTCIFCGAVVDISSRAADEGRLSARCTNEKCEKYQVPYPVETPSA